MNYYADLHTHSIESSVGGEVFKWNGIIDCLKTLLNNNVNFFAFSDHDVLNIKTYTQASDLITKHNLNLTIIPAIEFTVLTTNGKKGHVIMYFALDTTKEQLHEFNLEFNKIRNRNGINLITFKNFLDNLDLDFGLIAHVGKINFFEICDLNIIKNYLIGIEGNLNQITPNFKKVIDSNEFNHLDVFMFSDTHIWPNYKKNLVNGSFKLPQIKPSQFDKKIKEIKNAQIH